MGPPAASSPDTTRRSSTRRGPALTDADIESTIAELKELGANITRYRDAWKAAGHFVHIEAPDTVAEMVLDVVGRN